MLAGLGWRTLIQINPHCSIIVIEDPVTRPLEIVKLTAGEREPEDRADPEHHDHAQGYEEIQDVHSSGRDGSGKRQSGPNRFFPPEFLETQCVKHHDQ